MYMPVGSWERIFNDLGIDKDCPGDNKDGHQGDTGDAAGNKGKEKLIFLRQLPTKVLQCLY